MIDAQAPTKEDIIALETSYWEAMKRKDGSRTAALSGTESLVTGAQGVMLIAKDKMAKMTVEGNWSLQSYTFDDVQVSTPAPNVAIIAYTVRQQVMMNGTSQEMYAADSSTWIKGPNGWECHAHSETMLQDKAA